jgi:hypothetical protein
MYDVCSPLWNSKGCDTYSEYEMTNISRNITLIEIFTKKVFKVAQ